MLAGVPLGFATMLNISLDNPPLILIGILTFWAAGGFFGHSMQMLLDGNR